jgi:hypothetical protein
MQLFPIAVALFGLLHPRCLLCSGFVLPTAPFHGNGNLREATGVVGDGIDYRLYSKLDGDSCAESRTRRTFFSDTATLAVLFSTVTSFQASPVFASGGATAGRYTYVIRSIPNDWFSFLCQ